MGKEKKIDLKDKAFTTTIKTKVYPDKPMVLEGYEHGFDSGGVFYIDERQVEVVKLSDAEQEIETAQSTITSQAIQLERKDKEIQTLVGLLEECLPIIKDSCLYGMLELEYRIAKTLKQYET